MERYKGGDASSKRKQKKKKHHHHKKKKKETRSSSSESDGSEMEWVEASAPQLEKPKVIEESEQVGNKRDEWMHEEMFVATLSKDDFKAGSSRHRKLEAQAKRREEEEAIQKKRELNPHWKGNGTGLPNKPQSAENLSLPSTSVGDGGYGYLKKAYYRIKEQSQQEDRSMEEIAVERWGSLDKLVSLINDAESRMKEISRSKYSSNKQQWEDRRDKKPNAHLKPRDGRSPSSSPERSYRYEKPKHASKKERRIGHYSSSDHRRSKNVTEKLDISSYHSDEESDAKRQKHDQKDTRKQNTPSWKKTKPPNDDPLEQNLFVWDRTRNEKHVKENKNSNKFPSWKKPSVHQNRDSTLDDKASKHISSSDDDDSRETRKRSESPKLPSITSEDDLNKLAARCMKAELLGDTELVSSLKKQIEEARVLLKGGVSVQSSHRQKERVMLTKMDSSGQERPIHYKDDVRESQSKQKKKQSQKFFDDGSRYSLKQMFEREKLTTTDDNLEMFMDVAAACKGEDEENETSGISKKASNKMAHHLQEEKDVGRAIQQHQKRTTALEKCNYCLDQPSMKRHLIVSKCNLVYLCVPDFQSLVEGHCLIVPKRHVPSFLALDEEEWAEVEDLKRRLRTMFQKEGKKVIILETSRSFKYYPHAYLEVIPVPDDISGMAPLFFRKAILESESEWANNIKLIDLTKKDLCHSVPKNLPYFCVQFDPKLHAGYAHVIEDEKDFERNFGKEVIGGMLDIDYNYLFKNRKEDPTKKSKETLKFIKLWESLDKDSS